MADCNPCLTPMETTLPEPAPPDHTPAEDLKASYAKAIGSLMYLMLGTRPDIAFSVSYLSRHMARPTEHHMRAVKRVFRYLKGSMHLELAYRGDLRPLHGYSDADYGGDLQTRRSTSGYVFLIGSAPISWLSKRQTVVALSTCEAELMAQTLAAKEATWLRRLLAELGTQQGHIAATVIYGDNQGAIALSKDPQSHSKAKHINIQEFFIREAQQAGTVEMQFVPTKEQLADGLTKALPRPAFLAFRDSLGLEGPADQSALKRKVKE